jgi:hypothetical protein
VQLAEITVVIRSRVAKVLVAGNGVHGFSLASMGLQKGGDVE